MIFRPRSWGGLANFIPIAGMGHLISEPKFKIPTPLPSLLISDKSLRFYNILCTLFTIQQQYCALSTPTMYVSVTVFTLWMTPPTLQN